MKYVVAIRVSKIESLLPAGFIGLTIPEGLYAIVEAVELKDLLTTITHIDSEWLPSSGYESVNGSVFHIETYRGEGEAQKADVAVPVVEKRTKP